MGIRDVGFEEQKEVGSDEATQGQGEEDVAGAKLEPSSNQVGTKLEPPFQYKDCELLKLSATLKQFMDTHGDVIAFVEAAQNLGEQQGNVQGQVPDSGTRFGLEICASASKFFS